MTTFAIATLGCKVNTYESQGYAQGLRKYGWEEVGFKETADVYLIHSCAVTNTAAAKSRQKIHQAQRQNPEACIAVAGCYAQIAHEQLAQDPHIDLIVGSDQKEQLPALIRQTWEDRKRRVLIHDMRQVNAFEAIAVQRFSHQTRAYLKVQDGCNQFCSYCIIPYTRGAERSLAPEEVLKKARMLTANGHAEIVLTGIHTGRYGREHGMSLARLMKLLCDEVSGLQRLRISSIECNEVSDELIALMKQEKRIARHLHIPLQSGDNTILKAMNRQYTLTDYEQRIAVIRKELDPISISSDVICGFPMETEEQFVSGMDAIRRMKLSFLHVFPYSKRDGTKAAAMSGQLTNVIKKQRSNRLMELSQELHREYLRSFLQRAVDVLWEREENGYMVGHSGEYLEVYAPYDSTKLHKMETVIIRDIQDDHAIA